MTKGKMIYGGPAGGAMADAGPMGARKYEGAVAAGYDAKREDSPKWKAEQELLQGIINGLPSTAKVLDVPVGTGRLIPAFNNNKIDWTGVDVSCDMLDKAAKKMEEGGPKCRLITGSVLDLPFGNREFDVSFMIRLTRWLTPEQRRQAIAELCRVTDDMVLFTARVAGHPACYTMQAIHADVAANDGWQLHTAHQIGDDEYYALIEARRK
jgi:ubiquinone/menaquinone biosynthesis C-methylase UbiE